MTLDPEIFSQLRRVGGEALIGELFRTFVELGPERLEAVRTALEQGDSEATRKAVHSIRSSAATLGARALAKEAGRLERLARKAPVAEVAGALPSLEEAFGVVVREMEARLAELGTPARAPASGSG